MMENALDPLVSVLMPAYNSSAFLLEAIHSIKNQTYKNIEILILDDASTDRTAELLRQLEPASQIRIFSNPVNIGYLRSCNFLFRQAQGSLITFQDADDWSFSNRIEKQVNEFMNDDSLTLCATRSRTEVTIDGITIDSIQGVSTSDQIQEYIDKFSTVPFTCATIMIKKQVLDSIGPYRLFFDRIGAEHVDWALMICEKFRSKVVDEVLYYYRFNANSFTKVLDYSITKRKSLEYTKFFHIQRKHYGIDSLTGLDESLLEKFTASLEEPYLKEPTRIYRELALDFLHKRMYHDSRKVIFDGLAVDPKKIENWKLLFFVLLKSCFGFLRNMKSTLLQ